MWTGKTRTGKGKRELAMPSRHEINYGQRKASDGVKIIGAGSGFGAGYGHIVGERG